MRLQRTTHTIIGGISLSIVILLNEGNCRAVSLAETYPGEKVGQVLISREEWRPWPPVEDRKAWESLPVDLRKGMVEQAEGYLHYEWPELPATLFLEYVRNGNRSRYQDRHFARRKALMDLVTAECIEGKGRFLDDIVNGIWSICEESFWGVPAHVGRQKAGSGLPDVEDPVVPLFVAQTSEVLAWTCYLLGEKLDAVSPLVRRRAEIEMQRRVMQPCLEKNFGWMGFPDRRVNNWNPWCNSNWLATVLLMERDEERRIQAVAKILKSLDRFIAGYGPDGGCDEGPGYWSRAGGSLFDNLELLYSASGGKIDLYSEPLIQQIGRYIYRFHIDKRYFVNFADASTKLTVDEDLIYRYGRRIQDENLKAFGLYAFGLTQAEGELLADSKLSHFGRRLGALFDYDKLRSAQGNAPLLRDVWMNDIQVLLTREQAGSVKGFFLAVKGGHNAESHNHNDVGNFIVYYNGHPLIIDVGVETYTRKTFSSKRYDIWTMQSAYHNLPTIDGVMQSPGGRCQAGKVQKTVREDYAQLRLDIAGAYPKQANLDSWIRTVRLNRGKNIVITEEFKLKKSANEIVLHLMTSGAVRIEAPGELLLHAGAMGHLEGMVKLLYNKKILRAEIEEIAIEDGKLQTVWGLKIYRVLLRAASPALEDQWSLTLENYSTGD